MVSSIISIIWAGCLSIIVFSSVVASNCPTGFTLIHFDDVNVGSIGEIQVSPGYYNLDWLNVWVTRSTGYPGSGYITALSSGQNVALNAYGSPMSIGVGLLSSLETLSINSFVAAAAWNNDLILSIVGQRLGTNVFSKTVILQKTSATNIVLNWSNLDKITFTTSGGIGPGTHFAMDNLCITTGPVERQALLYKCDYWGDPQLIPFPKSAGQTATSTWCQISGPSVLYQTSDVLINVVNSGSGRGDIITSFDMTLYKSDKTPLCTLTQSDVLGTPRSCGSDVVITKTGSDLNVAYKKVPFSAWIRYSSWGGGHYKFTLFATLNHINDASSKGMCVKGCAGVRNPPQILITDSTTDKEIVTSAMADSVCNTFLKEISQQFRRTDLVAETTPGYFEAVRKACIIDVTVTGNTQFAEQCVRNIVTDMLTHTGEIEVEKINDLIKNTTVIAEQTIIEAEIQTETIVEGSTWPCKPEVPVCIMPFMIRHKFFENNIGK